MIKTKVTDMCTPPYKADKIYFDHLDKDVRDEWEKRIEEATTGLMKMERAVPVKEVPLPILQKPHFEVIAQVLVDAFFKVKFETAVIQGCSDFIAEVIKELEKTNPHFNEEEFWQVWNKRANYHMKNNLSIKGDEE